jgi:hypothetical protein
VLPLRRSTYQPNPVASGEGVIGGDSHQARVYVPRHPNSAATTRPNQQWQPPGAVDLAKACPDPTTKERRSLVSDEGDEGAASLPRDWQRLD